MSEDKLSEDQAFISIIFCFIVLEYNRAKFILLYECNIKDFIHNLT